MKLKSIAFLITQRCNMACENCSQAIPSIKNPKHMTWEEIASLVEICKDTVFPRLAISGGEPTLSPVFPKLASELRSLFTATYYELRTNGLLAREHLESFKVFDRVTVGFYPRRSPNWLRHLPDLASNIRLYLNTRFWDMHKPHSSKLRGNPWVNCYAYRKINVVQNRVYPCCNMFGLSVYRGFTAEQCSVLVEPDCLERVLAIDMAPLCRECPWPG